MIDHHTPYKHGLASDARLQHVPPSSSLNGWDFRDQEPNRQYVVWIVLAAVLLIGGSLIASVS